MFRERRREKVERADLDGIFAITKVTFCDVKKFINRISCSVKENDMVFKEKIIAQVKAYVKFLRKEGDVPVKEIEHRCGISKASVYSCLKCANQAQKKRKKARRPRLIDVHRGRKSREQLQDFANKRETFHATE